MSKPLAIARDCFSSKNKNPNFVVCFGELIVDMISLNTGDLINSEGFYKKFGGAPGNTACGLAKLGTPVRIMGKVGDDSFGHFLKSTLDQCGVETDTLIVSKNYFTTLAFVSLTKTGERDFIFYRGAHEAIFAPEVSLPSDTFILHFGSLTQTNDKNQLATYKLIKQAKRAKAIVSYDPNIRQFLWGNLTRAKKVILETIKFVDVIKVNEEEAFLLSGTSDITQAGKKLFIDNLDTLLITRGRQGCYFKTKNNEGFVEVPIKIKAVDTTGAGDAFNAGFIDALYQAQKKFSEFSAEELENALLRANLIAALTTTQKGAITAFPDQSTLTRYQKELNT